MVVNGKEGGATEAEYYSSGEWTLFWVLSVSRGGTKLFSRRLRRAPTGPCFAGGGDSDRVRLQYMDWVFSYAAVAIEI